MIEDQAVCEEIIRIMNECSAKLNETICLVQDSCNDDEFVNYRKAAGFVMGYIYTDVLRPIYKQHPELEPPELKD